MSVEVPRPGAFETAFATRLRAELDALPVNPLMAWPAVRRARRIAFATVVAGVVAAALLVGAVGAVAYGPPGVYIQNLAHSFGPRPDSENKNLVAPTPTPTPSPAAAPSKPPPTEHESPSPGSVEHESPEPTLPIGGESPEPRDGSSPSPPPDR